MATTFTEPQGSRRWLLFRNQLLTALLTAGSASTIGIMFIGLPLIYHASNMGRVPVVVFQVVLIAGTLIVVSKILIDAHNMRFDREVWRKALNQRLGLSKLFQPETRQMLSKAIEFRIWLVAAEEKTSKAGSGTLGELLSQIDTWLDYTAMLAHRLDEQKVRISANEDTNRLAVKRCLDLEKELISNTATNAQKEIHVTLSTLRKQTQVFENLRNQVRGLELRIENTVASIGIACSQADLLVDAQHGGTSLDSMESRIGDEIEALSRLLAYIDQHRVGTDLALSSLQQGDIAPRA